MKLDELRRELREEAEYRQAEEELKQLLDLSDEVLRMRLARGWSQSELARRVGTQQANISKLESGVGNPTFKFLQKVAKAFGTELQVHFERNAVEEYRVKPIPVHILVEEGPWGSPEVSWGQAPKPYKLVMRVK